MEKMTHAERTQALEVRLGVALTKPDLGLQALTHKSYVNEHKDENLQDNERLEFLGDAVVDLAISHRLMERFPVATEGELSSCAPSSSTRRAWPASPAGCRSGSCCCSAGARS